MHVVQQAADFLRSATHLSLFGFDIVVQSTTGIFLPSAALKAELLCRSCIVC